MGNLIIQNNIRENLGSMKLLKSEYSDFFLEVQPKFWVVSWSIKGLRTICAILNYTNVSFE